MKHIIFFILLAAIGACKKNKEDIPSNTPPVVVEDNFNSGYDSWIVDFADYPVGAEDFFELKTSHKKLPPPLDENDGAIFISGNNHSDDLFMFLKKQINTLKPNTTYTAKFSIGFASNAPSNAIGVGGPPGEAVVLGIGITIVEPQKIVINSRYRMNINKGEQINSGPDRTVIGNIANGTNSAQYVLLQKTGEFVFSTDNTGKVWASVSTDSGFEATTALYYSWIKIEFLEM